MTQISSYSLPQMTDLVKRSFNDNLKELPQTMRNASFVVTDVLPKNTGEFRRYAERLARTPYASTRDEGDTANSALVQYGYEKDAQVYTVALSIGITKRMRDAGKNTEITDKILDLTTICPSTMDLDLSHRLTFAWSTSYVRTAGGDNATIDVTVGDGLALISASHTLTGSASTYSNQITGNPAFSEWALETAEKSFVEETYDNLGFKMMVSPDVIVTTDDPNTCNEVKKLLKATADTGSSNSGTFNPYQNKYKHVINPRIATDAAGNSDTNKRKYWFLVASAQSDFYLCVLNEPYLKTPMDGNNGEEFSSENWNYLTACDYDTAIVTGRWIRGSKWDAS